MICSRLLRFLLSRSRSSINQLSLLIGTIKYSRLLRSLFATCDGMGCLDGTPPALRLRLHPTLFTPLFTSLRVKGGGAAHLRSLTSLRLPPQPVYIQPQPIPSVFTHMRRSAVSDTRRATRVFEFSYSTPADLDPDPPPHTHTGRATRPTTSRPSLPTLCSPSGGPRSRHP